MAVSHRSHIIETISVKNDKEMPTAQLGGYIVVCNNERMPEDIERYLLGLFCRTQERMRAKNPRPPYFLYNCSTRRLYGVFEASNEGGLSLEPHAWESKDSRKNGRPYASRYPAQVRVHMHQLRCPLEDDDFSFMPFNDDATKFRSELSQSEVEKLLRKFGVSSSKRSEKNEDDNDGEWEKVKSKSKQKRQVHSDFSKRCASPNQSNGRRRGTRSSNGHIREEDGSVSRGRSSFQFGIRKGRNYESRADVAENWRSDSQYMNRPCSTNISSLSCEDKGHQQIGANREISFQECADDELQRDYNSLVKSSFESYSAALKSGMHDENGDACIAMTNHVAPRNERNFTSSNGGAVSTDTCSSPGSVNGFPGSPIFDLHWGEILADPSQLQTEVTQKHRYSSDDNYNLLSLSDTSDEQGKQPQLVGVSSDIDDLSESVTIDSYDEKKASDALLVSDSGSRSGFARGHNRQSIDAKSIRDTSSFPEKVEQSSFTLDISKHGHPQDFVLYGAKDNEVTPNIWRNDGISTAGRFHDPDPAVNSANSSVGSLSEQRPVPYELYSSRRLHERLEGLRSPDSKQNMGPAFSRTRYTKPRTPKVFRQGRRVQESNRPFSEEFDFNQHKYQEETTRQQRHNKYKENILPTGHVTQTHVDQGPIPTAFPVPSSHLVHEHPCLTSPSNLLPACDDGEHEMSLSNDTHVRDSSFNDLSVSGAVEMESPVQQMNWGMRSPILLFLPVFSPVVGSIPSVLPLPPPVKSGSTYIETLHSDILEFAKMVRPPASARARVEAAIKCIRDAVKQLWPGADVEVFGSFSTGLCLSHSDVDVAVTLPSSLNATSLSTNSRPHAAAPLIRELAASLHQCSWCESLATIETACMPVIKLQCRPFEIQSEDDTTFTSPHVAIDITIGDKKKELTQISHTISETASVAPRVAHNGAAARDYVVAKLHQLPALAPLALVMKSYLHYRHLNDVYSGGLGSFALTLLLVFYLERVQTSCGLAETVSASVGHSQVPASVESSSTLDTLQGTDDETGFSSIPCADSSVFAAASIAGSDLSKVTELLDRADHLVTEVLGSMEFSATPNLGTLLLGFLHTFGHSINLSCVRLVLKGAEGSLSGIIPREPTARPIALWIDDPLNPGANVGAGSFNMWHVQAAMRDMLHVLTKPNLTSSLPSQHDVGPNRRLLDELFMRQSEPQGTQVA
ncbi:hypothetical protein O6H91_16G047000 [Diphasiastrum complanatum]|uniref:Uncharacterized protein n=1 Tax=Diphasiastrum complanatum TaxID=34168 RepID=A0ACC2BCZ5_DIPCM|nr:hypothetical protein O6H91_16G047000 [Diphasiastrum complanatum]